MFGELIFGIGEIPPLPGLAPIIGLYAEVPPLISIKTLLTKLLYLLIDVGE